MRNRILISIAILSFGLLAEGQTLYLPNGTSGIGISNNSGKIGIGTNLPWNELHVAGDARVNGSYYFGDWQLSSAVWPGSGGFNYYKGTDVVFGISSVGPTQASLQIDGAFIQSEAGKTNTYAGASQFNNVVSFPNSGIWNTSGNVGIGTTSPKAKLHINSGANNPYAAILATSDEDNNLVVSSFATQPNYGKVFSLVHEFYGNNRNNGAINFYRGGSEEGGFLTFDTYGKERLRINDAGNVGIGTANPQYKLDVKGQIRATEVLVQSVDQFADFVFDKDYRLPSLHEVNTFIQDNGHLPGIPSAQEVKDNGMSLVEMQVKLLQKVEELTLYSIKQQEEIKTLKDELNKLKKK